MIYAVCNKKYKNENDEIYKYMIVSKYIPKGARIIYSDQLKQAIKNKIITVSNLKLTSDNRLIEVAGHHIQCIKTTKANTRVDYVPISKSIISLIDCNKHLKFRIKANIAELEAKANLLGLTVTKIDHLYQLYKLETPTDILLVTNKSRMIVEDGFKLFEETKFKSIDLHNLDTSKIKTAEGMFAHLNLSKLDISTMNTSNIKVMNYMFSYSNIPELDINNFDTKNVKRTNFMFDRCKINNLYMDKLEFSNVTTMTDMFYGATIYDLDLSNMNTSKVRDMFNMFMEANIVNLNISNFNYEKVELITQMFCKSRIGTLDLGKFNINKHVEKIRVFSDSKIDNIVTTNNSLDIFTNYN